MIEVQVETNDLLDDQCMEDANSIASGSEEIDDDNDDDNENAISLEKLKKEVMGDGSDNENEVLTICPSPRPRTPEIPLQNCFMPSSTPEHLDPRYMCWNDIGVVRCYGSSLDEDAESGKYIEVEFHDFSFHNSMMMQNFNGYFLGNLSSSALILANAR